VEGSRLVYSGLRAGDTARAQAAESTSTKWSDKKWWGTKISQLLPTVTQYFTAQAVKNAGKFRLEGISRS